MTATPGQPTVTRGRRYGDEWGVCVEQQYARQTLTVAEAIQLAHDISEMVAECERRNRTERAERAARAAATRRALIESRCESLERDLAEARQHRSEYVCACGDTLPCTSHNGGNR